MVRHLYLHLGFSTTQDHFTRTFQVSLVPGLGTNGMHPGGYHNYFSLNLTGGYSASTYLLEVGVLSNFNTEETRGLQIAGLANLTGANAFAGMQRPERAEKTRKGFEANLSGLQISGLSNVVLNNVFRGQVTGGIDVASVGVLPPSLAILSCTTPEIRI